jgi:hypothetical protein
MRYLAPIDLGSCMIPDPRHLACGLPQALSHLGAV